MISNLDSAEYRSLLLGDMPLLDVRAPIEFEKGAFPCSFNLPLLDNEQRSLIGTKFQQQGQQAAIDLGWALLTPDLKEKRLDSWINFIQAHPNAYLYCFRGGLRSQVTQNLLQEAGINIPRIRGGYKALRSFLLDALNTLSSKAPLLVITGRTCSGKTQVIEALNQSIDLEGLACHRGSAFGARIQQQPTQINFENALAIKLLKHDQNNNSEGQQRPVLLEDEGKLIGRLSLPAELKHNMRQSLLVEVQTELEQRVQIALKDYVIDGLASSVDAYGEEQGFEHYSTALLKNLERIKKRLGGANYQQIRVQFEQALAAQKLDGTTDKFESPIATLLQDYYDPMYDYQRQRHQGSVIFSGKIKDVITWLTENQGKELQELSKTNRQSSAKTIAAKGRN